MDKQKAKGSGPIDFFELSKKLLPTLPWFPRTEKLATQVADMIVENLRAIVAAGRPVIARIPVIPRFNATLTHAAGLAGMLSDIGVREVHLLPFHQFGEKKYEVLGIDYAWKGMKQLHPEMLERYRQVFLDAGLDCSFK